MTCSVDFLEHFSWFPFIITMSWVWIQHWLSWVELSTMYILVEYYVLNSTHDNQCCTHQTWVELKFFCFLEVQFFFCYCSKETCGRWPEGWLERGPNNRQSLPWGFLFFRSPSDTFVDRQIKVLDPTGTGAAGDGCGWTGRIRFRPHILHEVPHVFLAILVHNLPPTTTGHNDHPTVLQLFPPHLLV
jgi:hypothetical protein